MRVLAFVVGVVAVLCVVALPRDAHATPEEEAAVARARELGLSRTLEWRRLLLYRRIGKGRISSQVDGRSFFAAENGRKDPDAELEATIRSFYAPADPSKLDEHGLCRFPARRMFLEEHVALTGLPSPPCPALAAYEADLGAESIALVYAANYLQNPASAFGHTLLRIKKKRGVTSEDATDIGIDYTAETDTKNPLLYAFKGVFGYFPGLFRFKPWDEMLREYAGSEARDLWEYELALSPREVRMLVLHLRELSKSRIDYLYLTENCSYQVIAAIDAAATRLHLVSKLKVDVLPMDTVDAVVSTPGLVRNVVYRPSVRSIFHAAEPWLTSREKDLVDDLAKNPDAPLPDDLAVERRARVLDVAVLLVDARHAAPMMNGSGPGALEARRRLVARRAALPGSPPAVPLIEAPNDKRPDVSHGSMRFTLGSGLTSQYENPFAMVGFRLALHDLADPPDGQPELAQLQFFDTRLHFDYARREATLERLTFAEVMQLQRLSRFEKKLSWRARAFGYRLHDRGCPDCFHHGPEIGVGLTVGTRDERFIVFAMADAAMGFAANMNGIDGSNFRVAVGPYGGMRARLPGSLVALVTGNVAYLPGSDLRTTFEVRGALRARLAKDVAMGAEATVQPLSTEALLASYFFF